MRFLNDTDREWELWGKTDPYFGVLSAPRFRLGAMDEQSRQEFFASGRRHVDHVMEVIRQRLRPDFTPARVLDYGCGVGRVVLPFAESFASATGVDISSAMVQEAAKNASQQELGNLRLLLVEDFESQTSEGYDLIHSFIVLQHLRPKRGETIFRNLLRRLEPGGIGAIHLTFATNLPPVLNAAREVRKRSRVIHGILNVAKGNAWSQPLMQSNIYSLNRIFAMLLEEGCGSIYSEFSDNGGLLGIMLYFEKVRLPLL
jgi:SAM-dependent methyltransferase